MQLYLTSQLCDCLDPLLSKINPSDYTLAVIRNAAAMYKDPIWVKNDTEALEKVGFKLIELDLRQKLNFENYFKQNHINGVFVAGGNTFYLLEIMKESGFFEYLKTKIEDLLYLGSSAGSVVICPNFELVKYVDEPLENPKFDLNSFGFIDKLILPHIGNPYFEKDYEMLFMDPDFDSKSVIKLHDNQAIWVDKYKNLELVEQN